MQTNHSIKRRITQVSEMPKDVLMGIPILTVIGEIELSLENYSGIIEYTDTLIRIRTKTGQIKVNGKNLTVEYYTNDEMNIHGRIDSIEFKH